MSFEELDKKFEKIAQTPRKTDIKREEELNQEEVEEKVKYETKFENPGLTGLLAAFQEKLKNRDPKKAESGQYETIKLTSNSVIGNPTPSPQNEVSEEQIDKLLNKEQDTVSEEIEVEQTVSKLRYEDGYPKIDNRPSIHDITSSSTPDSPHAPQVNTPQSTYSQGQQITDDEVARQLAIHNQKKAERKAQEQAKTSEESESQ
tara:strand:+ start:6342 stop:6950 length:609 start_codon:yes stop_codon:yes gene_type:complete